MIKKLRLEDYHESKSLYEDENTDMYYRLSNIEETDKLIKTLVRKWNMFKTVDPENFNAHVKNNSQEFNNLIYDALQALGRAMNATDL